VKPPGQEIGDLAGELIKSKSTSHSLAFIITGFMLFSLTAFGAAAAIADAFRWILVGAGAVGLVTSVALSIYAVFRRPELLRSETHVERMRILNIVADSDDPGAGERIIRQILTQPNQPKQIEGDG
jgi:hypothetical protein